MFRPANMASEAKEDHGIKQWLLHNIVHVFVAKPGKADLTNLYAGKQDGIVINNIFKPKEPPGQYNMKPRWSAGLSLLVH